MRPKVAAGTQASKSGFPCSGGLGSRYSKPVTGEASPANRRKFVAMSDFNNGYARPLPQTADMSVDAGLRSFMLGVYNKLALGLVVAGALAYFTGNVYEVQRLLFVQTADGRIGLTILGMIVQFSPLVMLFGSMF